MNFLNELNGHNMVSRGSIVVKLIENASFMDSEVIKQDVVW